MPRAQQHDRVYSHYLVIHFSAHPPSKLCPKSIAACSNSE